MNALSTFEGYEKSGASLRNLLEISFNVFPKKLNLRGTSGELWRCSY
jgi:hypothetical protein